MLKGDFSINFEQSKTPLKITPNNAWVRIDGFKNPFQVTELSFQTIKLNLNNQPEAKQLQVGQLIRLYFLDNLGELSFETDLRIFSISQDNCICQIPLYVTNEQILFDKLILEIQKNEIKDKKFINHLHSKNSNENSQELNYCVIKTDEEINAILTDLVSRIPQDNFEEKIIENSNITENNKIIEVSPEKNINKTKENKSENNYLENFLQSSDPENTSVSNIEEKEVITSNTPLEDLRDSIQNKFLLEGLEPPEKMQKSKNSSEKITHKRRENPEADAAFDGQNLNLIDEEEKTNEYEFNLAKHASKVDKDQAFDDSYDYDSELPKELIFSLSKTAPQKKSDEDFVINTDTPEDLSFTMREADDHDSDNECVDGDEDCIKNKLVKFFKKKTIHFNLNKTDGEEIVEKTDEEKDKEFQEARGKVAPQAHKAKFNLDI